MADLKTLEGKIIDSLSGDFDGESAYMIIKFKGGGKLNIVSFLRGEEGTAQLDVDLGKLTPEEIVGKKIIGFKEEFDGETDHLSIILKGGHRIELTPFSSSPESTASLETTVYSSDKIVAESLDENMYLKRGQAVMNQPQYEEEDEESKCPRCLDKSEDGELCDDCKSLEGIFSPDDIRRKYIK